MMQVGPERLALEEDPFGGVHALVTTRDGATKSHVMLAWGDRLCETWLQDYQTEETTVSLEFLFLERCIRELWIWCNWCKVSAGHISLSFSYIGNMQEEVGGVSWVAALVMAL